MRILVTQRGSEVIKEIEDMASTSNSINRRKRCPDKKRKMTITHFHPHQTTSMIESFNERSSRIKTDHLISNTIQNSEIDPQQIKTIKLTMSKITFPKPFIGKYENKEKDDKPIIAPFGSFLPTIESVDDEKLYTFREIIPPRSIVEMKKSFIHRNRTKEKMSRIDENNFRSIYEMQTPMEKLNEVLEYPKINVKKVNLIKYLNESDHLNPVALRSIAESDNNKISRFNKMCQILFHQENQLRLVKELIQGKLKEKTACERMDFQAGIDKMKEEVEGIDGYLKKYRKRIHNREKYRDIYNEIATHHWTKYDLNRLNKGQTKKSLKLKAQLLLDKMPKKNMKGDDDMLLNEGI